MTADAGDELDFPIADYDELRVSEILPLLPELELDELDVVRERELAGKRRSAVIDRIDDRMDELEGVAAPVAVTAAPPAAAPPDLGGFPIADYENLSVGEIVALIPDLSDDELDMLAEHEEQGQNRAAVLDAIDDQFEEVEIDDEEQVAVVPVPVKKIPAKRAPVKKIPATTAPAKQVVAKKLGVKKGTAKKVAVKGVKAPRTAVVKKVTAKKAPARQVAVKKAPARQVAVKKAPVKKAPARTTVVTKKVVKKVGRPAKKR